VKVTVELKKTVEFPQKKSGRDKPRAETMEAGEVGRSSLISHGTTAQLSGDKKSSIRLSAH